MREVGSRFDSDVGRSLTARWDRTHDVSCPVGKIEVILVNVADSLRDILLLLTAENATIGSFLTPQNHCNHTHLKKS